MSEPVFDSGEPIRLGERRNDSEHTRWGMLLVIFMRVIAALWIVQGLSQWQVILMVDGNLFDRVSTGVGIAVGFFAVMDLVAAVGLWLATPWGGILWLLIAIAQILVAVFALPDFFEGGRLVAFFDALLIALYMFLTYKAAHEFDIANGGMRRYSKRHQLFAKVFSKGPASAKQTRANDGI